MVFVSSQSQSEFGMAGVASKIFASPSPGTDWSQACKVSVIDPAAGALQLTPEFRDKAVKALMREVRRMKLRLQLTLALLYFRKFTLQCRGAATRAPRQYLGLLGYL